MSTTAGTAAAVMRTIFSDHRLQLQKGTILEVRLDRPLRVRWRLSMCGADTLVRRL